MEIFQENDLASWAARQQRYQKEDLAWMHHWGEHPLNFTFSRRRSQRTFLPPRLPRAKTIAVDHTLGHDLPAEVVDSLKKIGRNELFTVSGETLTRINEHLQRSAFGISYDTGRLIRRFQQLAASAGINERTALAWVAAAGGSPRRLLELFTEVLTTEET